MPLIDYNARAVHLRFALLGPPGAGKRSLLRRLLEPHAGSAVETRMVGTIERLCFRFTPANVEALDGHQLEAEVFALGGPIAPEPLWERLLSDLDAVLFVADSRPGALAGSVAALRELGARAAMAEVPVVLFYNQRDLPGATSIAEMEAALNPLGACSFGGSARTGTGVEPLLAALVEVAFAARR
jgi:hypothetical protein